jgi:hypothetical protein
MILAAGLVLLHATRRRATAPGLARCMFRCHMGARRLPAATDRQDAPDIGEGETTGSGRTDEGQPPDGLGRVATVAGGGARWGRQQPGMLEEADRLGSSGCQTFQRDRRSTLASRPGMQR